MTTTFDAVADGWEVYLYPGATRTSGKPACRLKRESRSDGFSRTEEIYIEADTVERAFLDAWTRVMERGR